MAQSSRARSKSAVSISCTVLVRPGRLDARDLANDLVALHLLRHGHGRLGRERAGERRLAAVGDPRLIGHILRSGQQVATEEEMEEARIDGLKVVLRCVFAEHRTQRLAQVGEHEVRLSPRFLTQSAARQPMGKPCGGCSGCGLGCRVLRRVPAYISI